MRTLQTDLTTRNYINNYKNTKQIILHIPQTVHSMKITRSLRNYGT